MTATLKNTTLPLTALLLLVLSLAGCQRNLVPVVQSQAVASPAASVEVKARYTCGAKTKAGTPCRKPVKKDGDRCWMHQGVPVHPCFVAKDGQPKEDCYYEDGDVTRPIAGKP